MTTATALFETANVTHRRWRARAAPDAARPSVPDSGADAPPLPAALHDRLATAFAVNTGHGLLQLGASEIGCALPIALAWWRDFAVRYMTALCATPDRGKAPFSTLIGLICLEVKQL